MVVARVSLEAISRAFREQVQYYRAARENAVQLVAPQHKLTFPFQTSGVALFSRKKIAAGGVNRIKSHRGDLVGELL